MEGASSLKHACVDCRLFRCKHVLSVAGVGKVREGRAPEVREGQESEGEGNTGGMEPEARNRFRVHLNPSGGSTKERRFVLVSVCFVTSMLF